MQTFDLTEHILKRYECDFFYYYINNEPANNNGVKVIDLGFGG